MYMYIFIGWYKFTYGAIEILQTDPLSLVLCMQSFSVIKTIHSAKRETHICRNIRIKWQSLHSTIQKASVCRGVELYKWM